MKTTIRYSAGDVRTENVSDATIAKPTDAVVHVTRACICGSDLWPYRGMTATEAGRRMGHEAIGIVEAIGAEVRTLKVGNLVVMPFAFSDGSVTTRRSSACVSSPAACDRGETQERLLLRNGMASYADAFRYSLSGRKCDL